MKILLMMLIITAAPVMASGEARGWDKPAAELRAEEALLLEQMEQSSKGNTVIFYGALLLVGAVIAGAAWMWMGDKQKKDRPGNRR